MKDAKQWMEVVADQALDQLRLRKKCSAYEVSIVRLDAIINGMTRERKLLVAKIISLGGEV